MVEINMKWVILDHDTFIHCREDEIGIKYMITSAIDPIRLGIRIHFFVDFFIVFLCSHVLQFSFTHHLRFEHIRLTRYRFQGPTRCHLTWSSTSFTSLDANIIFDGFYVQISFLRLIHRLNLSPGGLRGQETARRWREEPDVLLVVLRLKTTNCFAPATATQ